MDVLKVTKMTTLLGLLVVGTGCQISYYLKSAYHQAELLSSRKSLSHVLEDKNLSLENQQKLVLAQEAKLFAEVFVALKKTDNYSSFVDLKRPYVSWVVSAAPKWELKHHHFSYLLVGDLPYKGFFSEKEAQAEAADLEKNNLDTFVRGVSAYSTLGWFDDPVLSSMLRYKEFDLVNTIIHETVHATLYIKSSADFNERLATFVGNQATLEFYKKKEGENSPTIRQIADDNSDEMLFSNFISVEIKALKEWYKTKPDQDSALREKRFKELQERFTKNIEPLLKTDRYKKFSSLKLNNARLMVYSTYNQDLSDFEKLYNLTEKKWPEFIRLAKTLSKHPKPEQGLKDLIATYPQ